MGFFFGVVVGRLVVCLNWWFLGCLIGQFVGWLLGWLVGWLVVWKFDWSVHR